MEWIKVSDRLPNKSGDYLVCDEDHICTVASFNSYENWTVYAVHWFEDDITHWMPLPEPPK